MLVGGNGQVGVRSRRAVRSRSPSRCAAPTAAPTTARWSPSRSRAATADWRPYSGATQSQAQAAGVDRHQRDRARLDDPRPGCRRLQQLRRGPTLGSLGTLAFEASAAVGTTPSQINADAGSTQVAEAGTLSPIPLRAGSATVATGSRPPISPSASSPAGDPSPARARPSSPATGGLRAGQAQARAAGGDQRGRGELRHTGSGAGPTSSCRASRASPAARPPAWLRARPLRRAARGRRRLDLLRRHPRGQHRHGPARPLPVRRDRRVGGGPARGPGRNGDPRRGTGRPPGPAGRYPLAVVQTVLVQDARNILPRPIQLPPQVAANEVTLGDPSIEGAALFCSRASRA